MTESDKVAPRRPGKRPRKVTYSLPAVLLEKLELASGTARAKSGIVAEALEVYFSRAEKLDLEAEFKSAASDPLFAEDNEAILRDFASLDAELERKKR